MPGRQARIDGKLPKLQNPLTKASIRRRMGRMADFYGYTDSEADTIARSDMDLNRPEFIKGFRKRKALVDTMIEDFGVGWDEARNMASEQGQYVESVWDVLDVT